MKRITRGGWMLGLAAGLCGRAMPGAAAAVEAPAPAVLTIHVDRPGPALNPTQYGVFFEEISHAGDGGLYAELVRNRSFEDSLDAMPGWTFHAAAGAAGRMALEADHLLNSAQARALKIEVDAPGGTVRVVNEGWWGINVVKGRTYDLAMFARSALPAGAVLRARLQSADGGTSYASLDLAPEGGGWRKYTGQLVATGDDPQGRLALEITAAGPGALWLDVVSLFPPTWKGRPNGLRPDLAEMIARMKPSIIRLPGGTFVSTLPADSPKWLNELGPIEERPAHPAPGRPNPWGYVNTAGFGLHEYLLFAEDLGAEPIYVFQGGAEPRADPARPETFLAGAAVDTLIGEILAGIEYANGPTNTTWGARRAANGHPEPFNMNYVQIGNENFQRPFHENYIRIHRAIKDRHPDLRIIWGGDWIGNNEHGYRSDGLMPEGSAADIVDEHFYKGDGWFYENGHRYHPDRYPREHPRAAKIFIGEASAMADNLDAALKETAFLLGAERYSDAVVMAVYAPLLANVNAKNWAANAIYFDNHRVFGTPSYHAQAMLANHVGDVNLGLGGSDGLLDRRLFANATHDRATGEVILKVVHPGGEPLACRIEWTGVARPPAGGRAIVLTGPHPGAANSLDQPLNVAPVERALDVKAFPFIHTFPPHSFSILRLLPVPAPGDSTPP
jgi:alpha-L-arabinofuranosidase